MPEALIPIDEGQKASADDSPGAARLAINWLVDSNDTVRQRPGISNTTLDTGVYNRTSGTNTGIIGMYVWRSVFNQREYLVYVRKDRRIWAKDLVTSVVSAISDTTGDADDIPSMLDGNATQVIFAEDSQRLTMAGGGQLQTWNGNVATLTQRIAATVFGVNQPPLSATHVVALTNYLVANQAALPGTNNQIIWSGLGDSNHVTWSPLNFNTADADPDPIVAIATNLRECFTFGTKTVQAFGVGSDPTLPFSASATLALGCSAPYSVIRRDTDFSWMDENRRFVTSDARSVDVISKDINKLLRDFSTVADGFGFRLRVGYWDLLVWVFLTEGKTYAYDQARQKWFQWRGWNGIDDYAAIRIAAYAYWPTGAMHIVGDPLYENLWTLDITGQSDTGPGLPIVAECVTNRIDGGTALRKRCSKVRFFVKRGTTAQPATTPAYLDVAKKDDDGNWSGGQLIDLGIAGDYSSFKDWYPGGIYRRRQYRVRYSGGVDIAIAKMTEFWEPLSD
jgi:hypothetical protein